MVHVLKFSYENLLVKCMIFCLWEFKANYKILKEKNFVKMKISPVITSKENGTTHHRTNSFYCDKLYAYPEYNRSAKCFSAKVSRSESTCTKHNFEKRKTQVQV
jgi:hypothetical protein